MWYLIPEYREIMIGILVFVSITSLFWLMLYTIKRKIINKKTLNKVFLPKISIIIPAFNEANSIGSTLKSILSNNYPKNKMDIIVVDDGSTDNTSDIVKKFPVNLIQLSRNKGKVNALNTGIKHAKHDIIFTLDADSKLCKNFFRLMVKKFEDANVGAVCGIYKAKYQNKLIEKLQSLEYLGFALIRKLQDSLGAITVVPGAVAAFRKKVLLEVGGFDNDTLLEDADITIKVHKAGYKVVCEKNALAYVCAPPTIRKFVKQRTRWMRGGLQIWGKHFDMFSGKFGAISFLWIVDAVSVSMQFVVFSMLLDHIRRFGFSLISLKYLILNIISLNFSFNSLTLLLSLSFILFILGIINMSISIKITNDSMKKLLLYPLMAFYGTFQFLIFIKSVIEESLELKKVW
ncbi:MAG: glycosyltransferase [Candidatus Aenigmarchaeota archaeon]|nr:glycosyltransferase [Candidatus Aenigmarchaeota archaeon]